MIPTSPSLLKKQMKKPPFPVPSSIAESQATDTSTTNSQQLLPTQRQQLQTDDDSNAVVAAPFFKYFMATLLFSSVGFTLFYFHEHFQKKLALLMSSQQSLRSSNNNQQQQVFTTTRIGGMTVAAIAVVSSLISWISEKREQNNLALSNDNCGTAIVVGAPKRNEKSANTNQSSIVAVRVDEKDSKTDINWAKHEFEGTNDVREEKSEESVYKIVVTPVLESQPDPSNGQHFSIGGAMAGDNSKHKRKNRKPKQQQQLQQRKLQLSQIPANRRCNENETRSDESDGDEADNSNDDDNHNCYHQQRNNRFGSVFQKASQKNCNNNQNKKNKSNFLNPFEHHKSSAAPKSPISNASACSSIDSAERERFERAVSSGEFYLGEDVEENDGNGADDHENLHRNHKLARADSDEGNDDVEDEDCHDENDSNGEISDDDDDCTCGQDGLPLEDESLPLFVMLVGVPGSGKSTWCSNFESRLHSATSFAIIHSDEVRFEVTGNINDQTQNEFVWSEVLSRTRASLGKGIHTMLDATNVDTIRRRTFVRQLPPCRLRLKTFFVSESLARSRISKDLKEGTVRPAVPDKALCFMMKKFKESLSRLPEEGWRSFCEEDYLLA